MIPAPNRAAAAYSPRLLDALAATTARAMVHRLRMRPDLVWLYGPGQYRLVEAIAPAAVCYDLVDDYLAQPNYQSRQEELGPVHDRLMRHADVVMATSATLADVPHLKRQVHFVGNAADVAHFRRADRQTRSRPVALGLASDGPVLGFHGAMASHKLDLELIVRVATMRPDWRFVFVGPVHDLEVSRVLVPLRNVVLVGSKDSEALLDYVAHFDAAWVPYAASRYMSGVNPLKLYELIAAGTPTVVAGAAVPDELVDVLPHVVGPAQAVQALAESLGHLGTARARLGSAIADRFSWEAKARRCLDIVRQKL